MLYFWLLVLWLSPSASCLLFVCVVPHPDMGTVMLGTLVGFAVSIGAFFSLT